MKITGKLTLTSKLFENDQMAPGAYTYLMYFTYSWYLADSERDKKIWSDAIQDIRNTGYKRTGSKYWDDLISGMQHRPNYIREDDVGFGILELEKIDLDALAIAKEDIEKLYTMYQVGEAITPYEHYYRNKLNIEFDWYKFQKLKYRLPDNLQWNDNVKSDFHQYHQVNHIPNSKYVSACGHFEIIYNSKNIVQNQYNNPDDMGTYNYYNPDKQALLHTVYDVYPYDNLLISAFFKLKILNGYTNVPRGDS